MNSAEDACETRVLTRITTPHNATTGRLLLNAGLDVRRADLQGGQDEVRVPVSCLMRGRKVGGTADWLPVSVSQPGDCRGTRVTKCCAYCCEYDTPWIAALLRAKVGSNQEVAGLLPGVSDDHDERLSARPAWVRDGVVQSRGLGLRNLYRCRTRAAESEPCAPVAIFAECPERCPIPKTPFGHSHGTVHG